jgi:hypothetical protein
MAVLLEAPGDVGWGLRAAGFLALLSLARAMGGADWMVGFGAGVLAGPLWLPMVGLSTASGLLGRLWGRKIPFTPFLLGSAYLVWRFWR